MLVCNNSDKDYFVKAGDRLAQLILEVILTPEVIECNDLTITERDTAGFGSSGY